jgi:bacteriorhodopsin
MPGGFRWVWALVAAIVVVALFRMFFSRSRRTPGARGPGP